MSEALNRCPACVKNCNGVYMAGCRTCSVRHIASGPEFFASMRAGKLTPAYMALLQRLGTVEDVHAEVKAAAKASAKGSIAA